MMRYFIRIENEKLIGYVMSEEVPKDNRYCEYASYDEYANVLLGFGVMVETPTTPQLTADEERDIMLMDLEYRLIMLELGL